MFDSIVLDSVEITALVGASAVVTLGLLALVIASVDLVISSVAASLGFSVACPTASVVGGNLTTILGFRRLIVLDQP